MESERNYQIESGFLDALAGGQEEEEMIQGKVEPKHECSMLKQGWYGAWTSWSRVCFVCPWCGSLG